jgi:uncharacterized membrane protein
MQTWLPKQGILFIALAAILWGTVGVVVKSLYESTVLSPIIVGFYRLALSVPALLLALSFLGKKAFQVKRRDVPIIALLGAMLAIYQLCYFAAIPRVGVAIATLITLCSAPVIVALSSVIFLKERLGRNVITALVMAVVGTFLLVGFQGVSGGRIFSGVNASSRFCNRLRFRCPHEPQAFQLSSASTCSICVYRRCFRVITFCFLCWTQDLVRCFKLAQAFVLRSNANGTCVYAVHARDADDKSNRSNNCDLARAFHRRHSCLRIIP